jgi:HSP20 family protein
MLGALRRNGETALTRPRTEVVPRWDPWEEFAQIRTEMDRLFSGLFGPTPRWTEGASTFTPAVDLYETTEEVVLNTYLPGISREDLHIDVTGDTIRIIGETKSAVPEREVTVHVAQGGYGKFDFRYGLPLEIKPDQVKATYRNGVLEVRLPKAEVAKPRPVQVQIDG